MAYNNYGQNWMTQPGYPYYQSATPGYANYSQQAPMPQQPNTGMIWVDGEVGAKAFQMPQGYPVGTPIALWDTNDQVIYLKSINQMGMPNPLQKIRYQMEENQQQSGYLPAVGTVSNAMESNYATKEDLDKKFNELKEMLKANPNARNQNGSNNGPQNRGGNT